MNSGAMPLVRAPPADAHTRFCAARQAMIRALADWIATRPPTIDLHTEVEGTADAMAQLLRLAFGL